MKVCNHCNIEMINGKIASYLGDPVVAKVQGTLRYKTVGDVSCYICPNCGEIKLCLDDLSKLN